MIGMQTKISLTFSEIIRVDQIKKNYNGELYEC